MTRSLTDYDRIAIAEIAIYPFFLIGGIYLSLKHGFTKSSGWRFLIILSLARLIGASLLLATINNPNNQSLYVGYLVLNGVGFGPLVLMVLGLINRLFDSVNRQGSVVVKPRYLHAVSLLMLIAMILLVYGGTQANYSTVDGNPKIQYTTESQVGAGLMIAVVALLLVEVVLVSRNHKYISAGERRILIAVVASLPFIIVRLAYTCDLILGQKSQDVWFYLGGGVIMEIFVCLICQVTGLTLAKVPPPMSKDKDAMGDQEASRV